MGWFSRKQRISVDDFGQLLETYYMQYIDDLDDVENSPSMNYLIESVPEGSVNVFKVIGEFRILFCLVTVMALREVASKEKNEIMKQFTQGNIDILVSTSVIEVGIDVPNATIMMIEGAERFGLAQLYQFRGRVGRGEHQSYCLLFTDIHTPATHARLASVARAKNGFELAEEDLKLRGPGEFLGKSQTGMPDIAMQALQNPEFIKDARNAAQAIVHKDRTLTIYPKLKERLERFTQRVHGE